MEYLQENFYKKSNKELTKILDKTTSAIETKAYKMGLIISNKWTDEELKYLVANYSSVDNKDIIKFIDRNIDCIIMKAMELGLKKEVFNKKYNPDEFLKLRFKTFPFIVDWQMQIEGTSLVNNKEELNH